MEEITKKIDEYFKDADLSTLFNGFKTEYKFTNDNKNDILQFICWHNVNDWFYTHILYNCTVDEINIFRGKLLTKLSNNDYQEWKKIII